MGVEEREKETYIEREIGRERYIDMEREHVCLGSELLNPMLK